MKYIKKLSKSFVVAPIILSFMSQNVQAVSFSGSQSISPTTSIPMPIPSILQKEVLTGNQVSVPDSVKEDVKKRLSLETHYLLTGNKTDANTYNFQFQSNDNTGKNISITMKNDFITNYNSYDVSNRATKKQIPKITKTEAIKKAEDFAKKINPQITHSVIIEPNNNYLGNDSNSYNFTMNYFENDIPIENYSNIAVNYVTGEIERYSSEYIKLPVVKTTISIEKAKQIFKEQKQFKPIYSREENNSVKIYYTPIDDKVVDAKEGKLVSQSDYHIVHNYSQYGTESTSNGNNYDTTFMTLYSSNLQQTNAKYSDEEKKKIIETNKLIKQDEVDKIIKSNSFINLGNSKINNVFLSSDTYLKETFYWNVLYKIDGKKDYYSCFVINAKTGGIKTFDFYTSADGTYNVHYNQNPYELDEKQTLELSKKYEQNYKKYKDVAIDYFKKFNNDKFSEFVLQENNSLNTSLYETVSYSFVRLVNGIEFPEDIFSVTVGQDGGVMGGSYNYSNLQFPKADNIMPKDKMIDKLFEKEKFKKMYLQKYKASYDNAEYFLAYKFENFLYNIDALTGEVPAYFKTSNPTENKFYSDLKGNKYEKEISALWDIGIRITYKEKLEPDKLITEEEFIALCVASLKSDTFYLPIPYSTDDKYYNEMFLQVKNSDYVKNVKSDGKKEELTRNEMVQYLASFMDIKGFDDLKDVYKNPYKDVKENVGAVALLKGSGIIDYEGANFYPTKTVTRAEALHIIYNLISKQK